MSVKPRQPVPALEFDTLEGGRWSLAAQKPQSFTMVVFYRGLHCPICRRHTSELNGMIGQFGGYGVPVEKAREWGLYISQGRGPTSAGVEEPERFAEPGLFLVKPDGTLYWVSISTMPFARPHFNEIAQAIDFAVSRNYPARGEL